MRQRNVTDRRSGNDRRMFDDNILPPDQRNGIERKRYR